MLDFDISIYEKGQEGPAIFWMMYPFQEDKVSHFINCLDEIVPGCSYTLIVCRVNDWNRDLSLWPAGPVTGNESFSGNGPETLEWLINKCIPEVSEKIGSDRKKILTGYSLAGLFTLWAAYNTDVFDGYACCSGSLWFDGWEEYALNSHVVSSCDIYLSLGGKEEKTENKVMATIRDVTRRQEKILKADPNVRNVILEMNPGGHFADSGKRLAKGINWLIRRY